MSDDHKAIIQRNHYDITKNMDTGDVLPLLQDKGYLNENEVEEINAIDNMDSQVERLMAILMQKPDQVYDELRQILLDTQQPHIARLLDNETGYWLLMKIFANKMFEMNCLRIFGWLFALFWYLLYSLLIFATQPNTELVNCNINCRYPAIDFFVKWRKYPGVQLERYLQNDTVIWGPG